MTTVQPAPHATTGVPGSVVSILIVDDDPIKRFALRTILAPLGEDVVGKFHRGLTLFDSFYGRTLLSFSSISTCRPWTDSKPPQLIRQRPRSELTPIIFVTALDQGETNTGRGYELGAVDFVFAPVMPPILRRRSSFSVELHRAQQELLWYRTQLEGAWSRNGPLRSLRSTASWRRSATWSRTTFGRRCWRSTVSSQALLTDYGGKLDSRAKDYLEQMRRASLRMGDVFDGLQSLSA